MIMLVMIILHSGAGTPIDLNADAITNMRNPEPGSGNKLFSDTVRCQVNMVDGKYVAVKETCTEVRRLIEGRAQ
jgi:hypothetical protein